MKYSDDAYIRGTNMLWIYEKNIITGLVSKLYTKNEEQYANNPIRILNGQHKLEVVFDTRT